jgi:hypothetical protein
MIANAQNGTYFALRESFSGQPENQNFVRGCLMGHKNLANGISSVWIEKVHRQIVHTVAGK